MFSLRIYDLAKEHNKKPDYEIIYKKINNVISNINDLLVESIDNICITIGKTNIYKLIIKFSNNFINFIIKLDNNFKYIYVLELKFEIIDRDTYKYKYIDYLIYNMKLFNDNNDIIKECILLFNHIFPNMINPENFILKPKTVYEFIL
jgi:hypothetical protein